MKKYLFLDIDGVLNEPGTTGFERERCKLINYIRLQTGCNIVITSDRRLTKDGIKQIEKIAEQFEWGDLEYTKPIGRFALSDFKRQKEIELFLWFNEFDNYVVVDDMLLALKSNYVKINPEFSLTKEDADKIIKML